MGFPLRAPDCYTVVQRRADSTGLVPVLVGDLPTGSQVSARLTPRGNYAGETTEWVPLRETPEGYAGEITGRAGGWYLLEVRLGEDLVDWLPRVGIGEIFVITGQSNAANSGEELLYPEDERVVAYWRAQHEPRLTRDAHRPRWSPACDPQPGGTGDRGSPWPRCGDLLARSLQMPVAFASCAVGGSHTCEWAPGTEFFGRLVELLQELGPHGCRAVLWHQGESDTLDATSAEEYARRLEVILGEVNRAIGWEVPWMVAEAAFGNDERFPYAAQQAVRAGQRLLWERGVALPGPSTDDLTGPRFRMDEGGEWIHFNRHGLQVHGERWFAHLWTTLFSRPAPGEFYVAR